MEKAKLGKGEGIFNGIAVTALALYVIFIVVMIGSVVIYTTPKLILKRNVTPSTHFTKKLSLWNTQQTTK